MSERGWSRKFDDPIETPDGTRLNTLREAVAYFAKTVPKSELDMSAVTTATKMLTNAAERGTAWMFLARMAVMKALTAMRCGNSIRTPKSITGGSGGGISKKKRPQRA